MKRTRAHEQRRVGGGWAADRQQHVHLPPNFSAFDTVEDAVATAAAEGVRVLWGLELP